MIQALIAAIALVLALISPAHADVSAAQGQTSQVSGESTAIIAPGAVNITSNGAPESPVKAVINSGETAVKSVGAAIAPGVYNSSGLYTCFGGTSAAVGWMGHAVSGGTTREMNNCLGLHRMDKAAGRANAAVQASRNEKLSKEDRDEYADQAKKFSKLWDAEYCALDGGADAYEAAGMICPVSPKKAQQQRAQAQARPVEAP